MPGTQHADATATWADSAAAGTVQAVEVPDQERITPGERHVTVVHNPSAVTALTVRLLTLETFGGTEREAEVASFAVPAGDTVAYVSEGWLTNAGRVALSNDTALGVGQGFTANVRVREAG